MFRCYSIQLSCEYALPMHELQGNSFFKLFRQSESVHSNHFSLTLTILPTFRCLACNLGSSCSMLCGFQALCSSRLCDSHCGSMLCASVCYPCFVCLLLTRKYQAVHSHHSLDNREPGTDHCIRVYHCETN